MRLFELLRCVAGIVVVFLGLANASLTDEEKEEIVRAHNYYRGKVDPIATNMEQMVIIVHDHPTILLSLIFLPLIIDL